MNALTMIIQVDEEDVEAAEVLVDGAVGGHPYRFLLDTGAARTSVVADAYTATFDCIEQRSSSGVFGVSSDELISLPLLELGSLSMKDFIMARMPTTTLAHHNLIGMDVLKDSCCHFHFDENQITIDDSAERTSRLIFHELTLDKSFHPYVPVTFEGVRVQTVWDTGAGITVVDRCFIEQHPNLFQEVGHSSGTDSAGDQRETLMFLMASPHIGDYEFAPHKVAGVDLSHVNATTEMPMTMILGYSTLRQANWVFDFPRKRWAISRFLDISV